MTLGFSPSLATMNTTIGGSNSNVTISTSPNKCGLVMAVKKVVGPFEAAMRHVW